jgi:hypothetical protein
VAGVSSSAWGERAPAVEQQRARLSDLDAVARLEPARPLDPLVVVVEPHVVTGRLQVRMAVGQRDVAGHRAGLDAGHDQVALPFPAELQRQRRLGDMAVAVRVMQVVDAAHSASVQRTSTGAGVPSAAIVKVTRTSR